MLRLQAEGAATAKSFILNDAMPGKRIEIRPADMASPFGAQQLTGLGHHIVVHPMP